MLGAGSMYWQFWVAHGCWFLAIQLGCLVLGVLVRNIHRGERRADEYLGHEEEEENKH
jgi:hypothetical protein